jgi:hypothetical protein
MTSTRKISPRLADHPTVRKMMGHRSEPPGVIDADWLRQVCPEAGADDVAFASVDDPALASEVEHVGGALPASLGALILRSRSCRDEVHDPVRNFDDDDDGAAAAGASARW